MRSALLLIDSSTVGAIFGSGFFLALAGLAFVAYKSLRKTVKWAVRVGIVIAILVIALAGSITLWWYSSTPSPRSAPTRSR